MGDSTENTNKLDSYGVWVKRGPNDAAEESPLMNSSDTIETPNLKEAPPFSAFDSAETTELPQPHNDDDDMFITPPQESPAEIPNAGEIGDIMDKSLPNRDGIDGMEGFDVPDLSAFDIPGDTPTPPTVDIPDGEVSFDDLLGGGGSDGEISLDAFMSGDSDEISLDDFLDDFDGGSSKKEDDVPDSEPLDIHVEFNEDPGNQVPTEDIPLEENVEEETVEDESGVVAETELNEPVVENESPKDSEKVKSAPVMETVDFGLEEVSLDDFNLDESDDATAAALGASINSAASAEDGLAMFGKPKVVDYDLAITEDDVTQSAPTVEETESSNGQEQNTNTTTVDNSLLEQIVSDLAGLKNEITSIKTDLANLKEGKIAIPSANNENCNAPRIETPEIEPSMPDMSNITTDTADTPLPASSAEETDGQAGVFFSESELNTADTPGTMEEATLGAEKIEIPSELEETPEKQDVFFSSDDDKTTSLSESELKNIAATSEITKETDSPLDTNEEIEAPVEETEDNPAISSGTLLESEKTPIEMASPEETDEINADSPIEEALEVEEKQVEEELEAAPIDTEVESDFSTDFSEDSPFGNISDDNMLLETSETSDTGLSMDIDNDALEEPDFDEIEQNVLNEDISLPKPEEIPMADEDKIIPPNESAMIEEIPSDDNLAMEEKITVDEPLTEEPLVEETPIDDPFVEPAMEETIVEESAIEEPVVEEAMLDEVAVEEPLVEESVVEETSIEEPLAETVAIEETPIDEPFVEEPIVEDTPINDPFAEPAAEETIVEEIAIEESVGEEPIIEETALNEPVTEEPTIDEAAIEETVVEETTPEETVIEGGLDEAAVPEMTIDEPLMEEVAVESPITDETMVEEPIVEEAMLDEVAVEEPIVEESAVEEIDETVAKETSIEEPLAETVAIEETPIDEPFVEEPIVEDTPINDPFAEPAAEETIVEEIASDDEAFVEPVAETTQSPIDYEEAKQIQENYVAEIMEEDNSVSEKLSEENVKYLSEEQNTPHSEMCPPEPVQEKSSASELPANLKSEVKSVLLYMDQLLENLPEEKIVEFAKSDHFATYKKLFTDLGLA